MKEKLSLLWTLLLERFKVTILIVIGILLYGTMAYINIPREITPSIDIPVANIMTIWPGASPEDVEKLITNKIENEIKDLENIEKYTSQSLSGLSIITVEFEIESDKTKNIQNLRDKLDTAKKKLPDTILDEPEINEISMSDEPIMALTLSGDFSWSQLKQFAEIVETEIKNVPKIKDVSIDGLPEEQIHILVDPLKMESHSVSIQEVIQAIRANHIDMPLGQINTTGGKIEVSIRSELKNASEFLDVPIKTLNKATIHLGDFAEIRREFDEFKISTTFVSKDTNLPAVFINIIKSGAKGNVITMVEEAIHRIETLQEENTLPSSLNIDITFNRAKDIEESLDVLIVNGQQTLILIALVMFIALGWRESLLASVAIPLSMMIGIIVLNMIGRTFNGISLFALVLSIGLLVDNAIIIVEGISDAIHEKNMKPLAAAKYTLQIFRWPIISGTLTTIFAFLPMLFYITGISGQYVSIIPVTVITILLGALFISLFILPAVSVHFYETWKPKKKRPSNLLKKTQEWYEKVMKRILESPRRMKTVCVLTVLIFTFSIGLVVSRQVAVEVFPGDDSIIFGMKVEFPEGTTLEETNTLIEPIENILRPYMNEEGDREKWIKNIIFTSGKSSSSVRSSSQNIQVAQTNILGVTVNLTDKKDREIDSASIVTALEKEIQPIIPSHIELIIQEETGGPPTGAPIEIRVMGDDMERIEMISNTIKKGLEAIPETKNINDTQTEKVLQMNWTLKRDILNQFGLTPAQIIEPVRASVNGITVIQLTEGEDEVDVDLKIDWDGTREWKTMESLEKLDQIAIQTHKGEPLYFRQIAEPSLSSKVSQINHRKGARIITIQGDVIPGVVVSQLVPQIEEIIENIETLPGERIEFGGDAEEGNRIMQEMGNAMLAAILLIFLVLVFQFNSYIQPIIILAIVPLSLTSVFIGFWLMGLPLSFPTMIGIVALAGIIVNDAIVLIDRINHHKIENESSYVQAYIDAGKERMQPIFLTSITTVVGLLPLSLSDKVWAGLGFAIIFGMMLSTVLTLLLVPCFLIIARRIEEKFKRLYRRISEAL